MRLASRSPYLELHRAVLVVECSLFVVAQRSVGERDVQVVWVVWAGHVVRELDVLRGGLRVHSEERVVGLVVCAK